MFHSEVTESYKEWAWSSLFPFPSPHNLSQTIKIIISPWPLRPSRRPTGRQDYVGPSPRLLAAPREAGCLAAGLRRQQGRGRRGPGDSDRTDSRGAAVRGETCVVTGRKETSNQWQSPFSETVELLKKKANFHTSSFKKIRLRPKDNDGNRIWLVKAKGNTDRRRAGSITRRGETTDISQ